MIPFEDIVRAGGSVALEESRRFGTNDVPHRTFDQVIKELIALKLHYAVAGGMALIAHGHFETTCDIVIIVTPQALQRLHQHLDPHRFTTRSPNSRVFRDTQTNVDIQFHLTGEYPGDGRPKPIAFPDPAKVSIEFDRIHFLRLESLIELKLASGMTNPFRIQDFADVLALIDVRQLPRDFAQNLHTYVRCKFKELWDVVYALPPIPEQIH